MYNACIHPFRLYLFFYGSIDADAPNIPEVVLSTNMTKFGNYNVTVTLEWSQFSGETYSVATVPEPVNMSFIMSNSVQLMMLYNTEYNVMVAATLCGHRNATTNLVIYYGNNITTNDAFNNAWFLEILAAFSLNFYKE